MSKVGSIGTAIPVVPGGTTNPAAPSHGQATTHRAPGGLTAHGPIPGGGSPALRKRPPLTKLNTNLPPYTASQALHTPQSPSPLTPFTASSVASGTSMFAHASTPASSAPSSPASPFAHPAHAHGPSLHGSLGTQPRPGSISGKAPSQLDAAQSMSTVEKQSQDSMRMQEDMMKMQMQQQNFNMINTLVSAIMKALQERTEALGKAITAGATAVKNMSQ